MPALDATAKAAVEGSHAPAYYIFLDILNDPLRVTTFGADTAFSGIGDTDLDAPELVTNGTFSTNASGWTAVNSSLSVVSGVLRVTNTAATNGYAYQSIPTVIGKTYVASWDAISGTANAQVRVGTAPLDTTYINSGAGLGGSVTFIATTTATVLTLRVNNGTAAGLYSDFDNISLAELKTFKAFGGSLLDVSEISNSDGGSETLNVKLSGIVSMDTTLVNDMGNKALWQGRTARIWCRIYDETGVTPQGAIFPLYTGYMSNVGFNALPEEQTIQLTIENYLSFFSAASNRSYLNQKDYDAADTSAAATITAANGIRRTGATGVVGPSTGSTTGYVPGLNPISGFNRLDFIGNGSIV